MNDRKQNITQATASNRRGFNRPVSSTAISNAQSKDAKKARYDANAYKKLEGEYHEFKKESEKVAFSVTVNERKLNQQVTELQLSLENERQHLSEFKELAASDQKENEEKMSDKLKEIQMLNTRLQELHFECDKALTENSQRKVQIESLSDLKDKLHDLFEQAIMRSHDAECSLMRYIHKTCFLDEKLNMLLSAGSLHKNQIQHLICEHDELLVKVHQLESRESVLLSTIESLKSTFNETKVILGSTQGCLSDASDRERAKDRLILEGERVRRKLLVQIEEIKGNIRVYCRVRPVLHATSEAQMSFPDRVDHRVIEILQRKNNATSTGIVEKPVLFKYDCVFEPNAPQEQIFENIEPLVESAVDGYRVCILAYGQTGSGKTHTMEGTYNKPGVIPRSFEKIFESTNKLTEMFEWKFTMTCTYIEIYNDVIRDLLVDSEDYRRAVIDRGEVKHEIRHDGKHDTIVTGVVVSSIRFPHEVEDILKMAHRNRTTARTKLNERSSRSHSVFTVKIEGVNEKIKQNTHGVLCLIDLAGSERVSESGAHGVQFKEAVNINRSLSHLGDVIAALGSKEKRESANDGSADSTHIPFRNCKLTYLLQNFLGGDGSKVLLLVNISPAEEHLAETISSLRFASKVNATTIGAAKKKTFSV